MRSHSFRDKPTTAPHAARRLLGYQQLFSQRGSHKAGWEQNRRECEHVGREGRWQGALESREGRDGVLLNPSAVSSLLLSFYLPNLWQSTSVLLIPDDKV